MLGTSGCEEKILVSVRLRPLNEKEITKNDVMDWECINHNTIILRGNLPVPERSMYPSAYTFDNVFRWDCSTRQVYEEGTKGVALSVVSGINSSVFAYGQTSSGKTYTMRGITEYTIADIYDYMHKHKERKFLLKFSAMEIYNESVRDLLSPDSTPLRLLDDPERGTIVEKLTEETPKDWNHLKELLSICEAQRQIGETSLNEMSSRSHQILRLTMESSAREFLGNDPSTLTATVSFVDLAGSERASQALSAGSRLKEGCHINRSLLTLGTVIRKLSKGRTGHVPFRDSKLTRILQSSLGDNARTAIICTMSPARTHVEQSRNTLLFASCAKEVSTNAQVNVVMSDKALVKHLQREVARLENELKNYGKTSLSTDSVALLRQKDLQIVELRKEISELILERDLARSQVEESLHEEVDLDNHYPELRVQRSWDYENSISDASASVDLQSLDIDLHEKSEDTERHSRTNSEETYLKLPKFEDNFQQNGNSPRLSIDSPDFGVSDICNSRDKVGGTTASSPEILCKDVRCIEVEETNANRYVESSISSPESNSVISAVTVVHNGNKAKQDIISPPVKADREILHIQRAFIFGSPGELSPWILAEDIHNSSKGFKLKKSRSCKANLMGSYSSPWFEDATPNESTPQTVFEKDFIGRPEGLQKFSAMDHAHNGGTLSRICSQTSAGTTSIDECEAQNIKTNEENAVGIVKSAEGSKEMVKLQMEKQPSDVQQEDAEGTANESTEDVKDVRSDLIHDDVKGSSDWPAKFMRLRGEIIEFWHACNVSLVHRTYFFLLFKGDPTDSIYMEVEYRRLSFLRDTFARGNQTMEDGRTLSPASSAKALHQEREMLVRQMQKRLTEQDRENLYLKFGIKLNSKNRRFQLAYRLWSDTKDMDHITDSANIVAKLVGFVEPQQAFREMFGLNFAPWRRSRRLSSWRRGMVMSFS